MAGLRTDDVGEFHAFAIKGERHEVGGGLLFIDLTTVRYGGGV